MNPTPATSVPTAFTTAMAHYEAGRLTQALPYFHQALAQEPESLDVLYHAMLTLVAMRRYADAAQWLDQLLPFVDQTATEPWLLAGFHFNAGIAHEASGHWDKAAACYRRAIAANPSSPHAYANLGSICYRQGNPDEGYALHSQALAIPEPDPDAKPTLAFLKILRGDYRGGFRDYEARWKTPQVLAHSYVPQDCWRWKGKPLHGQRLLVVGEQGVGDEIMLARYIPLILDRGAKVTLVCYPQLVRLFQRAFPAIEVIASRTPHRSAKWWVPVLSLPYVFGTELATIPPATYLHADAPATGTTQRRIGWVAQGNALHMGDKDRSASGAIFAPLLSLPNIDWVDLSELAMRARFNTADFADDAAVLASCERIVSIDSAAAHCAGSLGVPVSLLPQCAPEWRYGLPQALVESSTPWYPTTHCLYRRQHVADWPVTIARLIHDLSCG